MRLRALVLLALALSTGCSRQSILDLVPKHCEHWQDVDGHNLWFKVRESIKSIDSGPDSHWAMVDQECGK